MTHAPTGGTAPPHRRLPSTHVVVVGAGPGGTATALLLARAGAHVTLLERAEASRPVGAGILLQPNGLAVLDGLGLADDLHAVGHAEHTIRLHDARGRQLTGATVPDFGEGLDHMLAVRRSDLASTIDAAVESEPGIDRIWGAVVLSASADGTVTFRRDGRGETLAADLVIGADGIKSAVRDRGDGGPSRFGVRIGTERHTYLRGTVVTDRVVDMAEYWTPLGLFGCTPLDRGRVYFYGDAGTPAIAAALAAGDTAEVAAVWGAALPLAGELLGAAADDALLVNGARTLTCKRWVDGRVALLGDAAHAMEPTLGQGANSAFVDAAVLLEELLAGTDPAMALRRYESRRKPAVWTVQRTAAGLAFLASRRGRVLPVLRNGILRVTDRPAATERRARTVQQERPAALRQSVRRSTAGQPGR